MKPDYFINMVQTVASGSHCNRLKVGAVIVDKDKRIVSTGYNGQPRGVCNECEKNDKTLDTVIHAELNAILYAKRDLSDCILYVTHSPCAHCAACIIQSGIKKVVYIHDYRNSEGSTFLKNHGVEVIKHS